MSVQHNTLHALSIHMKYGEVLHIDDISKDRKDNYLKLCTDPNTSIIVEDDDSIRNLLSQDVAKISVKQYSHRYRHVIYPIKRTLLSESNLGSGIFKGIIKLFVLISTLIVLSFLALRVVDGTILDVLFDGKLVTEMIANILEKIGKVYTYSVVFLVLLNIIDFGLSYNAYYPVNQDGVEPVEVSRVSNTAVILIFMVVFSITVRLISGIILL